MEDLLSTEDNKTFIVEESSSLDLEVTHELLDVSTSMTDSKNDQSFDATQFYFKELSRSQVTSHYPQAAAARMTSDNGGISPIPNKRSFK